MEDEKNEEMKAKLKEMLENSGEMARLRKMIEDELDRCGWREEARQACREVILARGYDSVTVEQVVDEVGPRLRQKVPEELKKAVVDQMRAFLLERNEL